MPFVPRVPQYESQVRSEGLPNLPGVNVNPGAFGGAVSGALEGYSSLVAGVARKQIAEADQIAVTEAELKLNQWSQTAIYDPATGVLNKKGKDAFNLPANVLPVLDETARDLHTNLTTRRQKNAFLQSWQAHRVQVDQVLNRHEAAERENFYDGVNASALKDSVRTAGNLYNDPKAIKVQLVRQEQLIQSQGARKGWSPEQIDEAKKDAHSLTHLEVIERMVAVNEKKTARQYFEAVRDQMRGDHGTAVEKMLQVDEAKLRSSLQLQLQDIEAAARSGVVVQPKDIPSRASLELAYGPDAGARLHRAATGFMAVSRDVNALHSMSTKDMTDSITNFKPTQVADAALAAERKAILATAASSIITEREQDRAGYLVKNNPELAKHWEAVMQKKEGALAEYMKAVGAEGDRLGISNQNVLPEVYAESLVNTVTNPKGNETVYAVLNHEAQKWGQHWPKVQRQIATKMPDTAAVISSGIPEQAGVLLSSMVNMKPSEIKQMVPSTHTVEDVELLVKKKFEPFLKTFPAGGVQTANAVQDAGVRLTLAYVRSGSDLNDAIEKAYNDLGAGPKGRYRVAEVNSVPYRIPANMNPTVTQNATYGILERLELPSDTIVGDFMSGFADEEQHEVFQDYVRQNGYFVTNGDGSGLALYVDGVPVSTRTNGQITYKWNQLAKEAESRLKMKEQSEAALQLQLAK